MPGFTVCVATIGRPYAIQRLLRSVRRWWPEVAVVVGDQNEPDPWMQRIYAEHRVEVRYVGLDAGVAIARQAAVAAARTEYVLICDDDFIFGPQTDPRIAATILDADTEIDIVGGVVHDLEHPDAATSSVRRWEHFLSRDAARGMLYAVRIDALAPQRRVAHGIPYLLCDTVLNWKLVRASAFQRGARWDPRFKCNGEHEDFYLNIKTNTALGVCYCPDLVVWHHPAADASYQRRRDSQAGWAALAEKWHLREAVELGGESARTILARTAAPGAGPGAAGQPHGRRAAFRRPAAGDWPASHQDGAIAAMAQGLRLTAIGAIDDAARASGPFSLLVRIDNPTGRRIGSLGPDGCRLSYRLHEGGGADATTTQLAQDIFPGTTFHYVNIADAAAIRDGTAHAVSIELVTPRDGRVARSAPLALRAAAPHGDPRLLVDAV
jgi:hypothetical protein